MFAEFREFLQKYNVLPIAIGLVLALAFAPLVTSVVNLVLSIIGRVLGMDPDPDTGAYTFSNWDPGGFPVGDVINALITFILMAWVVFMIIKALKRAGAGTDAAPTPEATLLTEIRDLLQQQNRA